MTLNEPAEWDQYWNKTEGTRLTRFYKITASFYRNRIIGPYLKHNLLTEFSGNREVNLMHAGCGGGEVDLYVPKGFRVIGLDFSSEALTSYSNLHPNSITVLGDILKLSELGIRERFDGIYNLGVMEHFSRDENIRIFNGFNKLLKPDGRIILFWPPSFGLSTIFLDSLHLAMKLIQGSKFRALVPNEPNRYKRSKSLKRDLETCGFKLIRSTFTYRDLFTFVTVVAVKNAEL